MLGCEYVCSVFLKGVPSILLKMEKSNTIIQFNCMEPA